MPRFIFRGQIFGNDCIRSLDTGGRVNFRSDMDSCRHRFRCYASTPAAMGLKCWYVRLQLCPKSNRPWVERSRNNFASEVARHSSSVDLLSHFTTYLLCEQSRTSSTARNTTKTAHREPRACWPRARSRPLVRPLVRLVRLLLQVPCTSRTSRARRTFVAEVSTTCSEGRIQYYLNDRHLQKRGQQ